LPAQPVRYEVGVTATPLALLRPLWWSEPTPVPTPSAPDCQNNGLCDFIYRRTGLTWLAESSYYLLIKPLRIVVILLLALLVRYAVNRMIRRLTRSASDGKGKSRLRPLRERIPSLQDSGGLRTERRRQRAEALASVLRSGASITIFTVTAMLILAELGVNLAPLIASAGIAGVAIGFGAQNLVKDFIAGLFMLFEDQYGVGDAVDLGEVSGYVEAVGLRITTIRDNRGVLWYIRNGEIARVGNRSQGWALVIVDVPVGFARIDEAAGILREAATAMTQDAELADDLLSPPEVLGIEQITPEGAVIRATAKTLPESQWRVGRELRRRLTEAIASAGLAPPMGSTRSFVIDSGHDQPTRPPWGAARRDQNEIG
jgi:moderate conductance mechanosensitive channel